MLRQFKISCIILGAILFGSFGAIGQCVPDSSYNTLGGNPDTLVDGTVGLAYSDTITFYSPADTIYSGFLIPIDSVILNSVSGLPSGLSEQCMTSPCVVYANSGQPLYTCMEIYGTPTAEVQYAEIVIDATAWITVFGSPNPINVQDTVIITIESSCNQPVANYTDSIDELTVYFTDQSSSDSGVVQWMWDFDDGSVNTQQNPMHTFPSPGTYMVCLTVTDSCGTDSVCSSFTVTCTTPAAQFTDSTNNLQAFFTDGSTGTVTTWEWDFGDGNTSNLQNPNHSYDSVGNYTVCLVAGNSCGFDTICSTVNITCVSNVNFSYSVSGFTVSFTDLSDSATSWVWDFGDGDTSHQQNPVHTYSTAGTYTFCLTVTDPCGVDSSCGSIIVNSIDDKNPLNKLVIGPNPTTGEILLQNLSTQLNATIEIVDLQGKLMYSGNTKNRPILQLDVSDFSNGQYFLHIYTDEFKKVEKIQIGK